MPLLIPSVANASIPSPRPQERLLQSARQKLLAPHVPPLLRITAFLRLSCLALEVPGAYSQLMQALSNHDPEWQHTCDILPAGTLKSTDPQVQHHLAAILRLHSN
jgi:hypothetical protein